VSPLVVYDGPVDSSDETVVYNLPTDDSVVALPLGQEVEVSGADLKRLKQDEAHRFSTGPKSDNPDAPWPDYDDLSADQVVERIGDPSHTSAAGAAKAVLAYEQGNEKRKTVLEAAKHQVEAFSVNEGSA
jgi:hypothetical protein